MICEYFVYPHLANSREIYQYLDAVDFSCDRTISNLKLQKAPCDYTADLDVEFNFVDDVVGDIPK